MKIAVIGAGISGLGAAYLLNQKHDVTVYEPCKYAGGHSRTIDVTVEGERIPVDTGFIVFNHKNYPHLTAMFSHLGVKTIPSDMSFGASISGGWLEYGSKGLFAQKRNILRPRFWGMIADILRFNATAMKHITSRDDMSLGEALDSMSMGEWFRRYYLQAMGAAIWSCSVETIESFPAKSFLRFFENHGLLTVNGHPQWYTVSGGSREYVKKLTESFKDRIRLSCGVVSVERNEIGILVRDEKGENELYDHVVFACHADTALRLLQNPSKLETDILSRFQYQKNKVIVHTDETFMPRRKECWASWVYLSENALDKNPVVSLTYWMNNLQNLKTKRPLLITLNPGRDPDPSRILDQHVFDHPVFTLSTLSGQENMDRIQNVDRVSYCGAYHRYGFHEDGLMSAVKVTEDLGVTVPWK